MPPKTPRFDPYQRLFYRLYEVILLLHNLNRTQGSHLVRHHDASDIVATRRRFLSNLAFLCDYKKGGDSTTAIAIEDTAEHYKFWIAMNRKPSQDKDVVLHTRTVLSLLKRASKLPVEETGELEMAILRISIKLATERISKEAKLLSASVQRCIMLLEETNHSAELRLAKWLEQFKFRKEVSFLDMCVSTWDQRHSLEIYQLERLSVPAGTTSGPHPTNSPFKSARHYFGRLANHVRVVKQIMEDSRRLQPLLESFHIGLIPVPEAVPLPPYDGHITLKGIIGRILQPSDPRRKDMDAMIATLRRIMPEPGIEAIIVKTFQMQEFTPLVHAEVQVLEFFSPTGGDGGRRFAFGDRFVGCSKLSCFGCKLYFQHHPSRPVARDSHERLWPQWSPPRLAEGSKDASFKSQRQLMQQLIKDIGEAAIDRISGLTQASTVHPDSVTDITRSVHEMDISESESDETGVSLSL